MGFDAAGCPAVGGVEDADGAGADDAAVFFSVAVGIEGTRLVPAAGGGRGTGSLGDDGFDSAEPIERQ